MQKNLEKYEILDEETKKHGLALQKDEITGYHLYERLSRSTKDPHNKKVCKGYCRTRAEPLSRFENIH